MDEDAVLAAIGEFRADIRNLGREIGEIKTVLKDEGRNCQECKKDIEAKIDAQDTRIDGIITTHTGEAAVKSWTDNAYAKIGALIVTLCSIGGLILALLPKGGSG